MNKPNADTELIRKYFNGELSPADQYALEKRALEDPFLQDAMDGFEQFSVEKKAFDELDNRLAERLKEKDKVLPIWGFKHWSIAASLIIGIAAISIYLNQTPENKAIAVSEIQKKERLPKSVKILEDTIVKNDENGVIGLLESSPNMVQSDTPTSAQAKEFSPAEEITIQTFEQMNAVTNSDSVAFNNLKGNETEAKNKKEISNLASRLKVEEVASLNMKSTLSGRTSGVSIVRFKNQNTQQIAGKVTAIEDGTTLPGVQITNTNNGEVVITDSKGVFKIAAAENDILTAKYVGFLTETIAINKRDSINISLQLDQKSLSEVVVTAYGTQKKSTEIFAGPKGGWKEFRKYLDENATLANNQKGKVIVQFIIQPDGKLTSFVIQKGINTTADNRAIQLIKSYETWNGSVDGKSQKAKVAVRFK